MKRIVLSEQQEMMLARYMMLDEGFNRKLIYSYFAPSTKEFIEQSTAKDRERYRIEALNWKKGEPKPRPIVNFYQPYIYVTYMMGHSDMITQPPTFRYSYFCEDFKINVNGRVVNGLLRISSKRASFDSFFKFRSLGSERYGFVDRNGIKCDFIISIVLPTDEETVNEVGSNLIKSDGRRITISEYLYNGEMSDEALHKFAEGILSLYRQENYELGEDLFGMPCDVRTSDGEPNEVSMKVDGNGEIIKKKRKHSDAYRLKQKLKAENAETHQIEVNRATRYITSVFFDGNEKNLDDFMIVNRKIGEIDPSINNITYRGQYFKGDALNDVKMIDIRVPLPCSIDAQGKKKIACGHYQYTTNGQLRYELTISRDAEGRVKIGNLILKSKVLTPIM